MEKNLRRADALSWLFFFKFKILNFIAVTWQEANPASSLSPPAVSEQVDKHDYS